MYSMADTLSRGPFFILLVAVFPGMPGPGIVLPPLPIFIDNFGSGGFRVGALADTADPRQPGPCRTATGGGREPDVHHQGHHGGHTCRMTLMTCMVPYLKKGMIIGYYSPGMGIITRKYQGWLPCLEHYHYHTTGLTL